MLPIFTLETPKLVGIDLRLFMLQTVTISTESVQLIYSLSVTLACFVLLALSTYPLIDAIYNKKSDSKLYLSRVYDIAFITSFSAVIVLARWPGFLAPELNPDESTHIAGAIKLTKDPIFWRSVDGTTSGPLNYYILTIPKFLGLDIEYASARSIALLLIIVSVGCLYFSLSKLYQKSVARIAILPTVLVFSFMTYFDYVHYNSEYVSIAITSIQLFLVFSFLRNSESYKNQTGIFLFGFLCGCIPFAKLQAVPISASMGVFFFHVLIRQRSKKKQSGKSLLRTIIILACGCLTLPLVIFFLLKSFSIFNDFFISYVQHSTWYADFDSSFLDKLIDFSDWIFTLRDTRAFFENSLYVTTIVFIFLFLSNIFRKTEKHLKRPETSREISIRIVFSYTLIILLSAIFSVVQTGRNFGHYVLFLIVPIGLLTGVMFGELSKYRFSSKPLIDSSKIFLFLTTVFLLTNGVWNLPNQIWNKNPFIKESQTFKQEYRSPISEAILRYAEPGDSVAIWGWVASLYVQTGTAMATRDVHSAYQIVWSPYQQYYQQRFASDLANSDASLFVDAVAPDMQFFKDRATQGFEQFSDISEIVLQNFKLVDEIEGVRLYQRFESKMER